MDFLERVGSLGLGSRLRRLSDLLLVDVRELYTSSGVDFDPKWFFLFLLISQEREITVTEAASVLKIAHPFVSLMAKEMNEAKLTEFAPNPADGRSRLLRLTNEGRVVLRRIRPLWSKIESAMSELLEESAPYFLVALTGLENAIAAKSLGERVAPRRKA